MKYFLENVRIRSKIAFIVISLGIVGIVVAYIASATVSRIDSAYSVMIDAEKAALSLSRTGREANRMGYSSYKNIAAENGSAAGLESLGAARAAFAAVQDLLTRAGALMPGRRADIENLRTTFADGLKISEAAMATSDAGSTVNAAVLMEKADAEIAKFILAVATLNSAMSAEIDILSNELTESSARASWMIILGAIAAAAVATILAMLIVAKGITGPLARLQGRMGDLAAGRIGVEIDGRTRRDEIGEMATAVQVFKEAAHENMRLAGVASAAEQAQVTLRERQAAIDNAKDVDLRSFVNCVENGFDKLADGDLTTRMDAAVAPEFEPIRVKFNDSVGKLEDAIGSVVTGISTIRTGLAEITVASNDLAQRTEQQAASLEETVAALSEVTTGVNQTAEGAVRAQLAAVSAQKNAEKGGEIVGQAVAAMAEIENSSEEIGKIIGVIDEIAFQTNLLALNAGVEAARAGEAGRGFAVVAQEVRGLAQRSAEAAKQIKTLISTSSKQVEEGVKLVTASGKSLSEIVAQVGEMSSVVTGIARSAKEQAIGLREVSIAADQMDKVTQQNAAMVEQATAAAQTLNDETETLAEMVATFRTHAGGSVGNRQAASPIRKPTTRLARPAVRQMRTVSSNSAPAPATTEWEDF
ncbi:methyl-accepting chemotaxis protein [Aureimonas sp. SA4125]|uniref:methyl-accepting chemotaxis protein n=1 Tax=Aureimonas sp. SA4125 TaxID=2826993 RepID=UPI001CC73880|nr:methyl-accepting chemotaxis protein [Aureimonas sp. SA4125]BDA83630.1 methyl-accepting chemotaxis protein [Aureimonas sp. SA4125]